MRLHSQPRHEKLFEDNDLVGVWLWDSFLP
jgi:hypothetical protein